VICHAENGGIWCWTAFAMIGRTGKGGCLAVTSEGRWWRAAKYNTLYSCFLHRGETKCSFTSEKP